MRDVLHAAYRRVRGALAGHGLGGLAPVRAVNAIAERHLERDAVVAHGHRMVLDPIDTLELRRHGTHEPFETELLSRLVRPGHVVLDLGAFIGYYTLLCARLVGPRGRVFAFEPAPATFELLRRNVRINGYRNVTLVNKAVGATTGGSVLHLSPDNLGDHRVYDSSDGRETVPISSARLDDELASVRAVDVVKMDVQGAERHAVDGMRALLARSPEVAVVTEFWPVGLRRAGTDPRDYLRLLAGDLGFELREANEEVRELVPLDPATFDVDGLEAGTLREKDYTNILCTR